VTEIHWGLFRVLVNITGGFVLGAILAKIVKLIALRISP
jgi:hypothetical protein